MKQPIILQEASFDPKLKVYLFFQVLGMLFATVIGIPAIPFWLLGLGTWWSKRYFDSLECILTDRSLIVKKGAFIKVEKTIPLDKIQDLTLREGPLLRKLGLAKLRIETAGGNAGTNTSEADLMGIIDAREFRDKVLEQRDTMFMGPNVLSTENKTSDTGSQEQILLEIRDSLRNIERDIKQSLSGKN